MLAPATAAKTPQPSPALGKNCGRILVIQKIIVNVSYKVKEIT